MSGPVVIRARARQYISNYFKIIIIYYIVFARCAHPDAAFRAVNAAATLHSLAVVPFVWKLKFQSEVRIVRHGVVFGRYFIKKKKKKMERLNK